MKEIISYPDFQKLDLKIATIVTAEKIEGSSKLLKITVSLGQSERQIISGIAKEYPPESLIGKQIVLLVNLEPRALMGEMSEGMLLAAVVDEKPILLQPEKEVPSGSPVS
jgi:methionine--tRNA ligase beta chain